MGAGKVGNVLFNTQKGASHANDEFRGLAVEQGVPVESLIDDEDCWISNGVSGFIASKLQLKR